LTPESDLSDACIHAAALHGGKADAALEFAAEGASSFAQSLRFDRVIKLRFEDMVCVCVCEEKKKNSEIKRAGKP
jgi:hypothetical protein